MENLSPTTVQIIAACIFALALLHTFSTKFFHDLAQRNPRHGGVWHLLGEVEVVFGFWAMVMVLVMLALTGPDQALEYVESRNFTEPMFVFVIMVVAATRPILDMATAGVHALARLMPWPCTLCCCPLCRCSAPSSPSRLP